MADSAKFLEAIKTGYTFKGETFKIGCGVCWMAMWLAAQMY